MRRTAISSRPSKAKREFDAIYAAVLPSVLARGCEFMRYAKPHWLTAPLAVTPHCSGRTTVGHHAKGRDLKHPEVSNAPENLRCLCEGHHIYVHANSRWAREVGLMLSRIS